MSTVIKVENISKLYRLGEVGTGTLSHDFNRWWHKIRGLEDPYAKIGEANDRRVKGDSDYVWALRDVSFEVKRGEILGIIGRNGAGKSTLLKILSRVTTPTSGQIKVKGRIASLLEVGTGFNPELTGRDNIYLNGAILGMRKTEIARKFDEIVAFAEVERYIDTPVKRYSSGMYVRLAFAVAAHLEPEILIVDEVLAVGDAEFQKKCLGKMGEVAGEGRTILFVSHQMGVVSSLCDRGMLMESGCVTLSGSIQEVVGQYLVSSGNSGNHFQIDPAEVDPGKNQVVSVRVVNEDGIATSDFSFSESIHLKIQVAMPNPTPALLLGVGLESTLQARVLTVIKESSDLKRSDDDGLYSVTMQLPKSLIAPNRYSFTVALFEPNVMVYDIHEHICPIQIIDDGTPLSRFEGVDYGHMVVDAQWSM